MLPLGLGVGAAGEARPPPWEAEAQAPWGVMGAQSPESMLGMRLLRAAGALGTCPVRPARGRACGDA